MTDYSTASSEEGWSKARLRALAVPLALLVCTLFIFFPFLASTQHLVVSRPDCDLQLQFAFYREFAFGQLRHGHLPLWNPYTFSGSSFFGNFQSALLYPINWVHLFLPLDKAINCEGALHVFLTGLWMHLWTSHRKLHPLATLVAAVMWMCGGPFFLKVYAGQLAPLAAMCWIPLVFLAIDLLFDGRLKAGILLGIGALAMQLLAGHPQTCYNTALAAGLYALPRLLHTPSLLITAQRWRVAAGLAVAYLGAAAIAVVQLAAGMEAAAGSSRAGGVPLDFARIFSFPPENFLTGLIPGLLGDVVGVEYWGRAYLWEVSAFMGIAGLALSVHAIAAAPRATRRYWVPMLALVVLALGGHTPLFELLYRFLPFFSSFRGHSRFFIEAAAFMAMLAACGFDSLLKEPRGSRWLAPALTLLAILFGGAGVWLRGDINPAWRQWMWSTAATGESFIPSAVFNDSSYISATQATASGALLLGAATCFTLALLWWQQARSPRASQLIAAVAVLEMLAFAAHYRGGFELESLKPAKLVQHLDGQSKEGRLLDTEVPDTGMGLGFSDIWGYDPVVNKRYLEFMALSQNIDPNSTNAADVNFTSYPNIYRMLRFRYLWQVDTHGKAFGLVKDALPHVLLLNDYKVVPDRDARLHTLMQPAFNPSRTVLLESAPSPVPAPDGGGSARVVEETTDSLTIEATATKPAILLVTDSYDRGWSATALPGSAQARYEIMPANHVLRAIPLQAGSHRLRLQYAPLSFHFTKWISMLALAIYGVAAGWCFAGRRRKGFPG